MQNLSGKKDFTPEERRLQAVFQKFEKLLRFETGRNKKRKNTRFCGQIGYNEIKYQYLVILDLTTTRYGIIMCKEDDEGEA